MQQAINNHIDTFTKALLTAEFTLENKPVAHFEWFENLVELLIQIKNDKRKMFFIGNGASASISAHFATDFTKNGLIPSFSNIDGAMLTCFSNDYSYETAYAEMLKRLMNDGDVLFAISSSGTSKNIVNATEFVKNNLKNSPIVTLTAFSENNPLRQLGTHNLYINNDSYSFAESSHAYYLHMLIDFYMEQSVVRHPEECEKHDVRISLDCHATARNDNNKKEIVL